MEQKLVILQLKRNNVYSRKYIYICYDKCDKSSLRVNGVYGSLYTEIYVNTFRPRQSCRHFVVDINTIQALLQIMAWRPSSDKPLTSQRWQDYRLIYPSLGLNELAYYLAEYNFVMVNGYI